MEKPRLSVFGSVSLDLQSHLGLQMILPHGFSIFFRRACLGAAFVAGSASIASADPIRHPTAIFAGLDKTTGRIINFDIAIDETVQFGALQLTPRVCNTRPQTEAPQTTTFVEVDELIVKPSAHQNGGKADPKQQEAKRIFSGWMFAASPGLHGVEHPVYDAWLVDCKGGKENAPQVVSAPDAATPAPEAGGKKRRSRKVEPEAPPPIENAPIGPADSPDAPAVTPIPEADAPAAEAPRPAKKKKRKPKPAEAAPPAEPAPTGLPF